MHVVLDRLSDESPEEDQDPGLSELRARPVHEEKGKRISQRPRQCEARKHWTREDSPVDNGFGNGELVLDDGGPDPQTHLGEEEDGEDDGSSSSNGDVSLIEVESHDVRGDDSGEGRDEGGEGSSSNVEVGGEVDTLPREVEVGADERGEEEKNLKRRER